MTDQRTTPTTTDAELQRRIGRAWREIRRGAAARRIKDLFYGPDGEIEGLDMALADALSVLCQQGPLRMGELAEALRITPASTTRAVTCLTDKGLAQRVKATDDQRSILVSATEAGQRQHVVMAAKVTNGLAHILSAFDDDEKRQLAEYLDRFVVAVDDFVASQDT